MSEHEGEGRLNEVLNFTAALVRAIESGQRGQKQIKILQAIDTELRQIPTDRPVPTTEAEARFGTQLGAIWVNLEQAWLNMSSSAQALAAAHEACRWLGWACAMSSQAAERYPRALNDLSVQLLSLDRIEEALEAAEEAVDLYRALHSSRPEVFAYELAASVANLGVVLSKQGPREVAIEAAEEAVRRFLALHNAHPNAFAHELAAARANRDAILDEFGGKVEGSRADKESLRLNRPGF